MLTSRSLILSSVGLALVLASGAGLPAESIAIGAGTKGGPYYRYGQALCTLLNRKSQSLECGVAPMAAGDASESFATIVNLRDGAVDIGIVRSDWLHYAVEGTGPVRYMHTKFDTLRSLFSIHAHPFTLLAKRDSGIGKLDDLEGRKVNLGRPHSDPRKGIELVMAAKGWSKKDFALAEELTPKEQSLSFCHDWVEAIFYLASHPDSRIDHVIKLCDAVLVDVSGPAIDRLVRETPYLARTTIPGGIYEGAPNPVESFGTTITVVASSDVPDDVIHAVVATVFENLDALEEIYPVLHYLEPTSMLGHGRVAPLHPGAERYVREKGLSSLVR